jgi:hypothetical protein
MPGKQRAVLLLLAALAVVAAIIIVPSLSDDEEKASNDVPTQTQTGTDTISVGLPPKKPKRPAVKTITVRDGKPVGGVQRLSFKKGQTVRFAVKSDVADEIHVHGYDLSKDVPAGGRAVMSFKAKSDGIYEIELEQRAVQIAQLRINP